MEIILGSWSGIGIPLIPISNILLTGVLLIYLKNKVYEHVKRSWNENEK